MDISLCMNKLNSIDWSILSSPQGIVIFIFGIIGAICIAIFSTPALVNLIKTKDSTSVSISMFIILSTGSFFFMVQGILNLIFFFDNTFCAVLGVTLANVCSFTIAFTTLMIKVCNLHAAKKRGISEAEYCKQKANKTNKSQPKVESKQTISTKPLTTKKVSSTKSISNTKKVGTTKKVGSTKSVK